MNDNFNPFPAYPVVRLNAKASQIRQDTISTPPIIKSRGRITLYAQQWLNRKSDPTQKIEDSINAVRGDYGTGKTHLLLDAASNFKEALAAQYPDLRIIRSCLTIYAGKHSRD